MAFSMNVDELDKEKVTEQLDPTPEQKTALGSMAAANASEVMQINLDSLDERRSIAQTIESFGEDVVEKSAQKTRFWKRRSAIWPKPAAKAARSWNRWPCSTGK